MTSAPTTNRKRAARRMPTPTSHTPLPMLRAWRASKLWTQAELAERAGIAVQTVTRAERGAPVQLLKATRLARALGTSVQALKEQEPPE